MSCIQIRNHKQFKLAKRPKEFYQENEAICCYLFILCEISIDYKLNGFYYFYISFRMGNTPKSPQDYDIVRNYRQQDWQAIQRSQVGEIWRNLKTHQQAQIYRLYTIPSIEDMNRYELRASQPNFVSVYHIALTPNQGICFNEPFVRLLIQYIPIKLQQVNDLQLEESLTILNAVFKGFNSLATLFGPIQPHQNLIGFNQWGKAKVWLNKSLNNNFPQQNLGANFDKSRVQPSHVRKIFDLIQRKTLNRQLPNSLKQSFRNHNPGYLQAILIIEQFAYQNELSLQRYIRTDILIRRSSVHQPNKEALIGHSRRISNQSIQIKSLQRPQLRRMQSVDNLHTQRFTNPSQSTVSIPIIQFKQNYNFSSGFQRNFSSTIQKKGFGSPAPKITFKKSGFAPINNHHSIIVNNEPNNSNVVLNKSEKLSRLSILGSPQHSICISSPVKDTHHKRLNIVHQVAQTLILESPNKQSARSIIEQTTNKIVVQIPFKDKESIQYRIQIPQNNNVNSVLQIPQADTMRSIIDKVDSELLSNEQSNKYEQQQYLNHKGQYEQYRQQDIQVSGTFNYKAESREQIHLQQSLEQIGEQEDYSKEKQNDSDIRIKDQNDKQIKDKSQSQVKSRQEISQGQRSQRDQVLKSQNIQIPIGFQSFALNKMQPHQFASFAPNIEALETLKSIKSNQNVQNVQTSKSFDCQDYNNQEADSIRSIEQMQEKVVQQQKHETQRQQSKKQQEEDELQRPQRKKRASIDIYYQKGSEAPFYAQYTPVQSKFDVVVKRDSILSRQSQRDGRPSAFASLQTDQQIQNYIRSKYDNYISDNNTKYRQQQVKVGRVQSQYQKHYVKQSESYDSKKQPKKPQIIDNKYSRPQVKYNKISNILQKPQEDFLDVNFLQKSLDKRYSSNLAKKQQDDELNIAKLDEGLMKFSTSKASLTSNNSKKVQSVQIKQPQYQVTDYLSKWDHSTGFQYTSKYKPEPNKYINQEPSKYSQQYSNKYKYNQYPKYEQEQVNKNNYSSAQNKKSNKKSVRIQNVPTHQFVYQLSSSDFTKFANFSKSPPTKTASKSPLSNNKNYVSSSYKKEEQKKSFDEKYNKYVKNSNKVNKMPKTPSIANLMSGKGESRLMLSPIPQKRWEDDGRLSYDHLRSFLWG